MYMPILKWRQGEYLALEQLESNIKSKVLPLVEIPPIEWDFENNKIAKSIDEHLKPFSKRLDKKWKNRVACIDLHCLEQTAYMKNGIHPLKYVFQDVRKVNGRVFPVTGLTRIDSYQKAVKSIVNQDKNGVCIRLEFNDLIRPNLRMNLDSLVNYLKISLSDVDLVLDLGAPNFEPIDLFANLIRNSVKKLHQIGRYRSFTIAATSFPESMGKLKQGVNYLNRLEWHFFLEYCSKLKSSEQLLNFGDYCIAHPKLLRLDMRIVSPSASLRYTTDDAWWIYKGTNVRKFGLKQYRDICENLVNSGYYFGRQYSAGDQYIWDCSCLAASTGNLTTWRRVATNHHITKVVNDCASFPGF